MTPGMTLNSLPGQVQPVGWTDVQDWLKRYYGGAPPVIAPQRNRAQELQDYMRYGPAPQIEGQPTPLRNRVPYSWQGDVPENTPAPFGRVNPPDARQFDQMLDWNRRWSEDVGWGV